MGDRLTNYTIARYGGPENAEWEVLDIRGGYVSIVMCRCPTEGKAKLLATLLNIHANDDDHDRTSHRPPNGGRKTTAQALKETAPPAPHDQV